MIAFVFVCVTADRRWRLPSSCRRCDIQIALPLVVRRPKPT